MAEPRSGSQQACLGETCTAQHIGLSALPEQDGDLAQIEVDEMLGLVCDVRPEVAADNAVPGRVVLLVKVLPSSDAKRYTNSARQQTHTISSTEQAETAEQQGEAAIQTECSTGMQEPALCAWPRFTPS